MATWKHQWTHYLGLSASFLCLVHCLALPIAMFIFPTFSSIDLSIIDSFWEYVFVFLTIISVFTIFQVHKTHNRFSIALPLAFAGVVLLVLSMYLNHTVSHYAVPGGSLLILAAHVMNLRFCNEHKNCSHHKKAVA